MARKQNTELAIEQYRLLPPWVQNIADVASGKAPTKTVHLYPSTVLRLCDCLGRRTEAVRQAIGILAGQGANAIETDVSWAVKVLRRGLEDE